MKKNVLFSLLAILLLVSSFLVTRVEAKPYKPIANYSYPADSVEVPDDLVLPDMSRLKYYTTGGVNGTKDGYSVQMYCCIETEMDYYLDGVKIPAFIEIYKVKYMKNDDDQGDERYLIGIIFVNNGRLEKYLDQGAFIGPASGRLEKIYDGDKREVTKKPSGSK